MICGCIVGQNGIGFTSSMWFSLKSHDCKCSIKFVSGDVGSRLVVIDDGDGIVDGRSRLTQSKAS